MNQVIASDSLHEQAVALPQDENLIGAQSPLDSIQPKASLQAVLERANLQRALKQVRWNKGAPGIDGMTVDELPQYLKQHWPAIREQLETGRYRPQPVRRVEIPKPDGSSRGLGIPTVLDRLIQQAIAQVLSPQWESQFHRDSFGFRPNRSAHQAVRKLQADIRQGYRWVVDLDLQAFFDRVNHDRLMAKLKGQVDDPSLLRLINRYLKTSIQIGKPFSPPTWGFHRVGRCHRC